MAQLAAADRATKDCYAEAVDVIYTQQELQSHATMLSYCFQFVLSMA